MRVISKKALREFWERHPDSEQPLKAWFREASRTVWQSPNHIKQHYPSASIIENDRMVFNIKGNHYRLVVKINYDHGMLWVRFIGTHSEYDKIDVRTV